MTAKQTNVLKPLKLFGLKDEMYPRFNFFKQRLLSIYLRFKTVLDKEKIIDLATDDKEWMKTIADHVDPLKDTVDVILIGNHEDVLKEPSNWNMFIASSRCHFKEDEKLTKRSLGEDVFDLDGIKNIATRPSVIVYILPATDDIKQAFTEAARNISKRMPESGHKSVILCNERLNKYCTLHDFCKPVWESTHKTLGELVQACLEEKVVAVFQQMEEFIQGAISTELDVLDIERKPLKQALSKTLLEIIKTIKGGGDVDSSKVQNLFDRVEEETCASVSQRYGVNGSLLKKIYAKISLREILVQTLKSSLNRKDGDCREDCMDKMYRELRDFDNKSLAVFEMLQAIDFEIKGVFRQIEYRIEAKSDDKIAKLPNSAVSKQSQEKILRINGVYGCGVILGTFAVHLEESSSTDVETVTKEAIKILMESPESKYFANHLEVKRIKLSPSASSTYESGQFLRVTNPEDHEDPFTLGTLGCFVKGQNERVASSKKLYAVSCAHVFPDGCSPTVMVSKAHPPGDWGEFGNFNPTLKMLNAHKIDIAAIAVRPDAEDDCNHCLKTSHGLDIWRSALHEGDIEHILGFQVYKWGSSSYCTSGLISSINYISHDFDSQLNVFIKKLDGAEGGFSSEGDSGAVVCFDAPTDETVLVVSLLNGKITIPDTGTQEFSYSVHLKKNLDELSAQSGLSFELYNP